MRDSKPLMPTPNGHASHSLETEHRCFEINFQTAMSGKFALCLLGSQQSSDTASLPNTSQATPLQTAVGISLCHSRQYLPATVGSAVGYVGAG